MSALRLTADGTLAMPEFDVRDTFEFNDWSKAQLANIVGVKWSRWFASRTRGEQASEVNSRLMAYECRLRVRTTRVVPEGSSASGTVTALLSESYIPLPDTAVLRLLATALREIEPDLRILRSAFTERTTSYVLGVGQPFRPGGDHEVGDCYGTASVQNSGVGFKALGVFAGFLRLACTNGLALPVDGAVLLKRAHRAFDVDRLRDTLSKQLRELPGKLSRAGHVLARSRHHVVEKPGDVFLAVLRAAHLPVKLTVQIAEAYDEEPALRGTAFGISQAITRASQRLSAEIRFELEQAAGAYLRGLSRSN
jgi:hypothetical protein